MDDDRENLNINANNTAALVIEEFKHAMKLGREREDDIAKIRDGIPLDEAAEGEESSPRKDT